MNRVVEILKKANTLAIISHIRPDGDTIGSTLALKLALEKLGKTVTVTCDDPMPEKFSFLQALSSYKKCVDLSEFDCLVAVDCGDLGRLGKYQYEFSKHKNTVNIDHHINSNADYAKFNLVLNYASTCEIMYEVIKLLNVDYQGEIGKCLYSGISTDTGNFMHNSTNRHTFECAANLVESIGDVSVFCNRIYRDNPIERFKLLADVLSNAIFDHENKLVMLYVTLEKLKKYGATIANTEGFVDYAVSVIGAEVGVCMTEAKPNVFKVSFRSKGKVDVYRIASSFGGGGHKYASASSMSGFIEEIIQKISKEVLFYL